MIKKPQALSPFHLLLPASIVCFSACATTKTGEPKQPSESIEKMSSRGTNLCVLTNKNQVYCLGDKATDPLVKRQGLPPVQAIAVSYQHACALTTKSEVYCWGESEQGEAGALAKVVSTPVKVENLPPVKSLAISNDHSCALTTKGDVYCWGTNMYGQLGRGSAQLEQDHKAAKVINLSNVVALDADADSTIATDQQGKLLAWGKTDFAPVLYNEEDIPEGMCNANDLCANKPYQWRQPAKTTSFAVGASFICTLSDANEVHCSNQHGQVRNDKRPFHKTNETRQMTKVLGQVKSLHRGLFRTCAITQKDAVWCWGSDVAPEPRFPFSNHGIGHKTPKEIKALQGVKQLVVGNNHVCGLKSGQINCWITTKEQVATNQTQKYTRKDTYMTIAKAPKLTRLVSWHSPLCGFTQNNELWCVSKRPNEKTFETPKQIQLPSSPTK